METWQGALIIGGMCVVVLLIGVMRHRTEILINFILRTVTGLAMIYAVNMILESQGIGLAVGINLISIAASGLLGVPGVALLYGVAGVGGF